MELHGVLRPSYPYTFGEAVCKARAFLVEFTSYASVLVIVSFSVERWLAICFPLQVRLSSTLGRAATVILVAWVVAFMAALPVALLVVVNRLPLPDFARDRNWTHLVSRDGETLDSTEFCAMDVTRPAEQKLLIYVAFIVFFLLPAVLISFVYGHIALRLKTADRYLKSESGKASKNSRGHRNRKSVLQVLVSVVVTFFVFWLPYHVQRLLSIFLMDNGGEASAVAQFLFTIVFYVSGSLFYMSSVCNPILYNVLSENFRRAFCHTILGEKMARKLVPHWSSLDRSHAGQRTPSRQFELSSGHQSRSLVVGKHSVARVVTPLIDAAGGGGRGSETDALIRGAFLVAPKTGV